MPYLLEFLTVALVHLLAVMSPGPDFAMVSRNALLQSRRAGILSAAGLAIGILVHVMYSLLGIGLLIAQSVLLFNAIKWAGAAYLIYVGWQSLRAKSFHAHAADERDGSTHAMTDIAAVRMGFLTNVTNPKVTLFFLALFTQVVDPTTPLAIQVLYGLEMSFATFLWFSFVAAILSHGSIKRRFVPIQHRVERVFGAVLIALGIRVALSGKG